MGMLALLVAIQLVPYGRTHINPPVAAEPSWDAPATRELVRQACFDCHSNETRCPVRGWCRTTWTADVHT